jgi:UTP--glucose-1-phosphate uridylyltransferase
MKDAELRRALGGLTPSLRAKLDEAGFDAERLITLSARLVERAQGMGPGREQRNRVRGTVEPPRDGDVRDAPEPGTPNHPRLSVRGLDALRRGELAFCVLAGGMATRMGGVVKALVEAVDGHSFLELRLQENAEWARRAGAAVPLWLMTSDATDGPIREELARLKAPAHVATFRQDLGLRLAPDGALFLGDDGQPSTYAPGHGDLPDALRRAGLLSSFLARGGRYVWIANLDNLGATLDPAILGWFLEQTAELLVEVAPKANDRGGIPVWADSVEAGGQVVRRLQVLEEFRLPKDFNASAVRVFNTNTFLVRADALAHVRVNWNWFEVEKNVGDRVAVQFERLLQELTAALLAVYLRVPREGPGARFLPVKDFEELARRRDEIRAVAKGRGML